MTLELSFKQVCEFVKKDGKKDPKLIEAVDNLLGIVLICSPVVVGPAAVALLPTLAVKNELVKIGKFVFDKLSKKDDDYVARQSAHADRVRPTVLHGLFRGYRQADP
jgi:hypothetical protein